MATATANTRESHRRTFTIAGLVLAAVLIGALTIWAIARFGGEENVTATNAAGLRGLNIDLGGTDTPRATGEVREYDLRVREAAWEIAPGVSTNALTFNGTVPGPTIRVTEGDTLRVTVTNESAEPTSVHWHGLHVPNGMDGVPPFTQDAIEPGESFTYEFPVPHAGTFMYHSHLNAVEQIDRGLYGLLIIDPQTPAETEFDEEFTMMLGAWAVDASMPASEMESGGSMPGAASSNAAGMNMDYNYFTINGKAFPLNETWKVRQGDLVRVRIANISNLAHPMHLHGADFKVVAKDGEPLLPAVQQVMNTVSIDAGETYDIVILADNPGTWVFHCHELHHTENDGVEPGGLIQVIEYEDVAAQPTAAPSEPGMTPAPQPEDMPGMDMPAEDMPQDDMPQEDMPGMDMSDGM